MGTILHPLLAVVLACWPASPALVGPRVAPAVAHTVEHQVLEPAPDRHEFVGMTDELVDTATWAVGLFDEAGLELPPLRFVNHGDDSSPCGSFLGVHTSTAERSEIGLCRPEPGPRLDALILHEISHAWLDHALPEARQTDFQALRGYEHWRSHEAAWYERGCEQAAEIMTWGLIDRPIGILTIHDHSCDDLDAGYRTLTGAAPLHGHRDHC